VCVCVCVCVCVRMTWGYAACDSHHASLSLHARALLFHQLRDLRAKVQKLENRHATDQLHLQHEKSAAAKVHAASEEKLTQFRREQMGTVEDVKMMYVCTHARITITHTCFVDSETPITSPSLFLSVNIASRASSVCIVRVQHGLDSCIVTRTPCSRSCSHLTHT
jgi:hypothetical protein